MEELLALLLTNPQFIAEIDKITVAIGEMVVRGVEDLLFKNDTNPDFKAHWLAASAKLKACQTLEEKQNVLKEMGALRASNSQ